VDLMKAVCVPAAVFRKGLRSRALFVCVLCLSVTAFLYVFAYAQTVESPPSGDTQHAQQQPAGTKEPFTNTIGQTFVYIRPGTFMMGSPAEERNRSEDEARHSVTLTRGFYMQTTEVTQYQWQTIMGKNLAYFCECGSQCPVESVSWEDVQGFIKILNQRPGTHRYRLPTEAEWEYAARAGSTGPFAGTIDAMGWYRNNAGGKTHPVGKKRPNAWGLYDMHGNVSEWVHDWYAEYRSGRVTDPKGPSKGYFRVNRGGGWDMPAFGCRSAQRIINGPGSIASTMGFRLVAEDLP